MPHRLRAQFHEIRLDLRRAGLRRRERGALERVGRAVAGSGSPGMDGEAGKLSEEIAGSLARIARLAAESRASIEADRADMAEVPTWVRPAVVLRGLCTRLVLRYRCLSGERALRPRYQTLGSVTVAAADRGSALVREVAAIRAELARLHAERERWVAPFGGTALPRWSRDLGREVLGLGRAVTGQLRAHFLPKAPALAGLLVGWWIANTYTSSHLRSGLRSLGIGSGGTRVVSSSTYEAMSVWLPLLAAALCGYLGERIAAFYRAQDLPPKETSPGR